jgi:hypothetical protein
MIAFMSALLVCAVIDRAGAKRAGLLLVATLIVCAIAVGRITGNWYADFGIPLAIISISSVVYAMSKDLTRRRRGRGSILSMRFLHLGLLVTLLGVFFSSVSTAMTEQNYLTLRVGGDAEPIGETGLSMRLDNAEVKATRMALECTTVREVPVFLAGMHGLYRTYPNEQPCVYEANLYVSIYEEGRFLGQGSILCVLDEGKRWSMSSIYIQRSGLRDVYTHIYTAAGFPAIFFIDPYTPHLASFEVRVNDFVSLVWIGCTVLSVSVLPLMVFTARELAKMKR